jgi:DNA gyrase/topoisomerase IV subunit A
LVEEIEGYEAILAEHRLVLDIIVADCDEMKARYGRDRRTVIEDAAAPISTSPR